MKKVFVVVGLLFFSSLGFAKVEGSVSFGKKATAQEVAACKAEAKQIYNQSKKKNWQLLSVSATLDSKDQQVVIASVSYEPNPGGCSGLPSQVVACYSFGQRLDVYCKNGEVIDIVE